MKLVAVMPVRNEDWCLGLSARVALTWCDSIAALDHASTDGTAAILTDLQNEFPGRVDVTRIDNPSWDEMSHRDILLGRARAMGATHIAIVDADEILTGNLLGCIRQAVEAAPRGGILQLPGYNTRGGIDRYHSNGIWGNRWFSVAFADDPRLCWSGDQFHHREPMGINLRPARPFMQAHGGIVHLWGASEPRLKAKHALYKITETLRWPEKQSAVIDRTYSLAFEPSRAPEFDQDWQFKTMPDEWLAPYAGLMQYLNVDSEPWQAAECARMIAEQGRERFSGLDLFGVA